MSKASTKISEKISSPCMNYEQQDGLPHDVSLFTRERIASKIKDIRKKYKKSVDCGRRSGGGRTVATFYDVCNEIWGGCPSKYPDSSFQIVYTTNLSEFKSFRIQSSYFRFRIQNIRRHDQTGEFLFLIRPLICKGQNESGVMRGFIGI